MTDLDIDTLMNVVYWAELSKQVRGVPPGYESWGEWRQAVYADDNGEDTEDHSLNREVCGTAFCIAGQVTWQNNYRMMMNDGDAQACIPERPTGVRDSKGVMLWEDVPGASPRSIPQVAGELLGITWAEAERLFDGENSLDKIKSIVNQMCESRRLPLAYPDTPLNYYEDHEEDTGW